MRFFQRQIAKDFLPWQRGRRGYFTMAQAAAAGFARSTHHYLSEPGQISLWGDDPSILRGKDSRDFWQFGWYAPIMPPMSPSPKNLRPELIRKLESLSEEDLVLVHEILLHTEKERLWRELSAEMAKEHEAGKFERLPELIREVRAELKRA